MSNVEIFLLTISILALARVFGMMTHLVRHETPEITSGQQASQAVINGIIAAFGIGFIIT